SLPERGPWPIPPWVSVSVRFPIACSLRAAGLSGRRVSGAQPGDRAGLVAERAQPYAPHARDRGDVLLGDAQLGRVADEGDPVFRPERAIQVIGESVTLDGEDRNRVAHADEDQREAMLLRACEHRFEKLPGLLGRLPVEELAAKMARLRADAVPGTALPRRKRFVRYRTKAFHIPV